MEFSDYLADLPLLHSWDGGVTWNTGGFQPTHLAAIHKAASRYAAPRICETGAGNSTLTFLQVPGADVVTIAPDGALFARIRQWCDDHGLDRGHLDLRRDRSEVALPTIAFVEEQRFDVALIDGLHGWPNVFVDFCYVNAMLGAGGLLLIDDLQIHAVAELGRLLAMQPGFELLDEVGKLQFWEKQTDERFLPGHNLEPYIVKMSGTAAG